MCAAEDCSGPYKTRRTCTRTRPVLQSGVVRKVFTNLGQRIIIAGDVIT